MGPHRIRLDPRKAGWAEVRALAADMRRGGVAAIPTDTVYGLAAHGLRASSARRIFQLKRRPDSKPILLLVGSVAMARRLMRAEPACFAALAAHFWPGPLTLVAPAAAHVPPGMRSATGSVAIRLPQDALVRRLAIALGAPLTGTSANRSGRPPARSSAQARRQFRQSALAVVDGRSAQRSTPSTVLDITVQPARILRQGPVGYEALRAVIDLLPPAN